MTKVFERIDPAFVRAHFLGYVADRLTENRVGLPEDVTYPITSGCVRDAIEKYEEEYDVDLHLAKREEKT